MNSKEMNSSKPIIGIAGEIYHHPKDTVFKNYERHFCGDAFVIKIREAGGIALMVPYIQNFSKEMISDYISSIDGLLIPGGDDIDPSLYNEQKVAECGEFDRYLDNFHIALIREAEVQGKSLLGICRGAQIINVALGGSLYQDIKYFKKEIDHSDLKNYEYTTHNIKISDNTLLKKILKVDGTKVNSLHHQIIKKVADSLKANAYCEDGVIEGIESTNNNQFIIGVQWHPETMKETKGTMNNIFKSLIDSCK
jgi:putative glutamine amidotransferase